MGKDQSISTQAALDDSPGGGFAASWATAVEGPTPFTEFSPYLDGPAVDQDQELMKRTEWWDRQEVSIAECMAKEGFDYTPQEYWAAVVPEEMMTSSFNEDFLSIPLLPERRAEVEKWGYGTHGPLEVFTGENLTATMPEDPNAEYFSALSFAAQLSYNKAYWGYENPTDAAYADLAGCLGRAADESPEPATGGAAFTAEYSDLIYAVSRLASSAIFEDPGIVALAAEWNKCMARAGTDVSGETDANAPGSDLAYANPASAWYLAMRMGADGVAGEGGGGVFEDSLPLDQRSLTGSASEVKIALADFDCRAETDYAGRFKAIQMELEQRFVDQNRDRLEQMVAAAKG
ncbi:MAG: hypothetical protein LBK95_14200 [Bifidobacteriaceae bacterium]|nr:hypothetical protein [Bifidobacteriaceae bacterium]